MSKTSTNKIEYGIFDNKNNQYGMNYDNNWDAKDALDDWQKDMPHLTLFLKERTITYGDWK